MPFVLWISAFGCGDRSTDPGPTSPDSGTATDTATSTGPPEFAAQCALDPANTLRERCTIGIEVPTAVEVEYVDRLGLRPPQVVRGDDASTEHHLVLRFLLPDTDYDYTVRRDDDPARSLTGTFRSGALDSGALMHIAPAGVGPAPLLGMVSPCMENGTAVIVDPVQGVPIWYQPFSDGPFGFLEAVSFTEDRTVIGLVDSAVREVDLDGNELLSLELGEDFARRPHHDVFRRNGLTYLLFNEEVTTDKGVFLLDGFYVFDRGGAQVGEWHLSDHFTPSSPSAYPFAIDVSHANAIWVDTDLTTLVSFRHLSAVAEVDGDPASPTFGALHWVLSTPTSGWPSDFTLSSEAGPADFFMQHNVHRLENGHLTFLDNRALPTESSRVVELQLDETTMAATIVDEWPLPNHCDFQGGAWRTANGDPLATCAPIRTAWQVDDADVVQWTAQATCEIGFGSYVPRFVPLEW